MFRNVANLLLRLIWRIVYRVELAGTENVPRQGGFIAMMNHIYFIDPVLVASLAPRFIVIMSKIENYRSPLAGLFVRAYGTFAVHRGELDMGAIRTSLQVLEQGHGLLMAPEGTRSRSHTLQEGKDGLAWLATRSGVPVVPVALSGHEKLWTNARRLRRTPFRITFGQPFVLRLNPDQPSRPQLRLMTRELMYRLAGMLPPEYRGAYSDVSQATDSTLLPVPPEGQAG
ncbi:MAG: 1-acyl-sn-glycerol-3-phosphate acyltransferase [Chloroflexi bacterium ADurb.Bin180]|nr:MAG: 1-acyl-sn-glycerol-3-phosphate acyltransferase [Chloroflexi bacterium ADurb.Bin180]